jgi:hypothetical protein
MTTIRKANISSEQDTNRHSGHLRVFGDLVAIYVICRILPSFVCIVVLSLAVLWATRRCECFTDVARDGDAEGTHAPPSTPIEPVLNHPWSYPFDGSGGGLDGLTESEDVSDEESRDGEEWKHI